MFILNPKYKSMQWRFVRNTHNIYGEFRPELDKNVKEAIYDTDNGTLGIHALHSNVAMSLDDIIEENLDYDWQFRFEDHEDPDNYETPDTALCVFFDLYNGILDTTILPVKA